MRLVCPNCAAQYEVDASLLPAEGTDVQCSACSTVWFQPGTADGDAPVVGAQDRPAPRPARSPPTRKADERPSTRSDPAPASRRQAEVPRAKAQAEPSAPPPPPPPEPEPEPDPEAQPAPPTAARPLDPSVAEVLQEEAAFEAKQRAQESSPLETQAELGLFGPVGDDTQRHRGGASRLPDIEDISSTLEPIDTGRGGKSRLPQTGAARQRSFLTGLALPVGLAGAMGALYWGAPMLAQLVPALDGPLDSFVALVDKARMGVAGLIGVAP